MSIANNIFSAFSFITFILVIIPFPWHLEAWNTGTLLYMTWTSLTLLGLFINSIVWNNNAINWAPVWCDITTKMLIGVSVALPATSLCINRRLYCIASVRSVTRSISDKRRAIMFDLAIGAGIPILVMILHYIVQGHRSDILQEVGCWPSIYNTWATYLIIYTPPLALASVSFVYCVLSIREFRKRRKEFKEILSSNSNLNSNRYFRLMALAGTDAVVNVPMNIVIIVLGLLRVKVKPFNWADIHEDFGRVDVYPSVYWQTNKQVHWMVEATRWNVVICGLLFFLFFGFGDEAQRHYKLAYSSIAQKLGITSIGRSTKSTTGNIPGTSTSSSFGNKFIGGMSSFNFSGLRSTEEARKQSPIYISQEVVEKRDSVESFRSTLTELKTDYTPSERGVSPYPTPSGLEQSSPNLAPPRERKASVPSSVTPSNSFLDFDECGRYNFDKV